MHTNIFRFFSEDGAASWSSSSISDDDSNCGNAPTQSKRMKWEDLNDVTKSTFHARALILNNRIKVDESDNTRNH